MSYIFTNKIQLLEAIDTYINDNSSALLIYGNINSWDVSLIEDLSYLFRNKKNFKEDISNWNVCNAKNMSYMFDGAIKFNCNLNNWDVSNVIDFNNMFANTCFNYLNIIDWNLTNDIIKQLNIGNKTILTVHEYCNLTKEEKENNKECPITMEPFCDDSVIIISICGHIFSSESIICWLRSNKSCPICRKKINVK
jgi:hypothetical protein